MTIDKKPLFPYTKHGQIADALSTEIRGGRYSPGDLLPSEPELSQRFGVSRHTVRAALRSLSDLNLVASEKGIGTRVQQTRPVLRYSHGFSSAEDLLQYATTTKVRVLDKTEVAVDDEMAERFGCKTGEHWWRVRTARKDPVGDSVVAYSEIHIPLAYGAALQGLSRSRQPIFSLIVHRFGVTISEIRQEITCIAAVTREEAQFLHVPEGSPAMQITRRYFGENRQVIEVARSLHPNEVFKYSMRVQLNHGAGNYF
ncbi:MAG: GntR family transcriptional regulator [Polaromonas sp.]|jgi:GntR family transcriptional regulator|nr:GntR family transcriptional regulator [Polaromonas sp.]